MKLLLTSFKIGWSIVGWHSLPERIRWLPPLCFKESSTEYFPDLSALLFCEKLIIDESTFSVFTESRFPHYSEEYCNLFKALKDEGFLELRHYWSDIAKNSELLDNMLERDMRHLDIWIPALRESCEIWRRFLQRAAQDDEILNQIHHFKAAGPIRGQDLLKCEKRDLSRVEEALRFPSRLRHTEYRDAVRAELDRYLSIVNASLVLANEYGCGVYDWADHGPFYREKFLSIGVDAPLGARETESLKKLFEVAFPQLAIKTPKALIRVLRDKRVRELRKLVHSAAAGETEFDLEFANRTLQEVVKAELRLKKLRKYISYATLPLGFLPIIGTPIQQALGETVEAHLERNTKKCLSWYYMLSEVVE